MRPAIHLFLLLLFPAAMLAAESSPQLVIAHRGASGYLPEHTLAAKALAIGQGADYLEQDVVMTSDDALIVFHDLTLERTTDVASRFPDRARDDGSWYVIDFTLAELRQLVVSSGKTSFHGMVLPQFPGRYPLSSPGFRIHTLQEELGMIAGLAVSSGRRAGIYTEIKSPWFHHQHGKDLAAAVLDVFAAFAYTTREDSVFLQSFDYNELLRIRQQLLPSRGMDLKLVQLIAPSADEETFEQHADGTWLPYSYEWMHTVEGLQQLATVVSGIGPAHNMLVLPTSTPGNLHISSLTADAQRAGLLVHPYTFRNDLVPAYFGTFSNMLDVFFNEVGVDGVFTDFPDLVVQFLQAENE